MWAASSKGYHYQITAEALIVPFMAAFALHLSGLREITLRFYQELGTSNFSSLSHALARTSSLVFIRRMINRLECHVRPARGELIAIDGMAVTLPATQRHRCAKYNGRTAGGGVIWSFAINARPGSCAVRILKTVVGAWRDATRMRGVALEPDGPIYLMDRGFFALDLIRDWLTQKVRFIVRVRKDATYEVLKSLGRRRRYRTGWIEMDAWVRLGSNGMLHPEARLIRAVIGDLIVQVVTSERRLSAEAVLDAYRKRERIEKFHQCLKDVLGLAHLYSFAQNGLEFLLCVALLLAMLLVMTEPARAGEDTVAVLRRALKALRRQLGLGNPWKRNTYVNQRKSHKNL